MTPKTYNDEFKAAAAKLVREQGYPCRKAAESLGVRPRLDPQMGPRLLPRPRPSSARCLGRGAPAREPPPPRGEPQAPHGARDFKKSDGVLREGAAVRFAFIRDHKGHFPVAVLCDVLQVSRSGYYAWTRRPPSPAALRREGLVGRSARSTAAAATLTAPRVYTGPSRPRASLVVGRPRQSCHQGPFEGNLGGYRSSSRCLGSLVAKLVAQVRGFATDFRNAKTPQNSGDAAELRNSQLLRHTPGEKIQTPQEPKWPR